MGKKDKFDYEALKKKTLEQLRSGKPLFGKDGAFAPLLKDILEAAVGSPDLRPQELVLPIE
jgi:putative transposase